MLCSDDREPVIPLRVRLPSPRSALLFDQSGEAWTHPDNRIQPGVVHVAYPAQRSGRENLPSRQPARKPHRVYRRAANRAVRPEPAASALQDLVTSQSSRTRYSRSEPRNMFSASSGEHTTGSPRRLREVLSNTPDPVRCSMASRRRW